MIKHLVFDVNETLLDVAALDPMFQQLFEDASTRKEWFYTLEENWLTATITNRYQPFGDLAKAALIMVGERREVEVSEADQQALIDGIMQLPAHSDASEALALLQKEGFTLTALTNGTLAAVQKQLSFAGLAEFFDQVLSVDTIKRYKPAPESYRYAAEQLGIRTADFTMVAAHAWDTAGASAAGCRSAFVGRPGKVINPAGPVVIDLAVEIVFVDIDVIAVVLGKNLQQLSNLEIDPGTDKWIDVVIGL